VVAISQFVMNNFLKRPLAEKSRWRNIRLAIKPRYLGNHAFQIKSYYGTLSRSLGRTFSIHREKSREAPPGVEITMTSYPACNKDAARWTRTVVLLKLNPTSKTGSAWDQLKTARWRGAPIPVLTPDAAFRPAASIVRPTASLYLCSRNYGRGLVIYA